MTKKETYVYVLPEVDNHLPYFFSWIPKKVHASMLNPLLKQKYAFMRGRLVNEDASIILGYVNEGTEYKMCNKKIRLTEICKHYL